MPWNIRILDHAVMLEHHKLSSRALSGRGPPDSGPAQNPRQVWPLPSSAWLDPGWNDTRRWKLTLALLRTD